MRSIGSSNGTAESSAVFEDRSDKSQYVVNNTVIKVMTTIIMLPSFKKRFCKREIIPFNIDFTNDHIG